MKLEAQRTSILALATALALASCGKSRDTIIENKGETKVDIAPTVVNQSPQADEVIRDSALSVKVLGGATLRNKLESKQLISKINIKSVDGEQSASNQIPGAGASAKADDSLYIQIPVQLLGQGHLFGGVITTVSNRESDALGRLKLTDLPPLHVRPLIARVAEDSDEAVVVLVGCMQKCSETSAQEQLIGLPVVGQTEDGKEIVMDVSKFGESLNLMTLFDPDGEAFGLKTVSTRTTAVDLSNATIVWDVEHKMVPKDSAPTDTPEVTLIGARYYLKLESALNSAFVSRKQVPGVGFFTTGSRDEELITRFSQTELNGKPIHYFIKNVPAEHQGAFAASFDGWNATFAAELGRELISYEFVSSDDPKSALLVAGDVRYNIVEWDLVNQAPYGGLGPSIASQTTGEIFSANVLVQGPTIEVIYKEWFRVSSLAKDLIASGKQAEADALVIAARRKIFAKMGEGKVQAQQRMTLGSAIGFRHHAQDERMNDQLAARQDFFDLPTGETYESYMKGYFLDLVAHELGHNLGLRHNFKGNLLASADGSRPSGSIMEYLNREFRHKDSIGEYDHMAIAYGYAGVLPKKTDIFCTDEEVVSADGPTLSAECSRDDATNDSFTYLTKMLDRVLDRLVDPTTDAAPTWAKADLDREIGISITSRIAYATSAEATSKQWLNWNQPNRPRRASAINRYVGKVIHDQLCAPVIRKAASRKATPEGKAATLKNLAELDAKVAELSAQFKLGSSLSCAQ